jgi:hypothetical protein
MVFAQISLTWFLGVSPEMQLYMSLTRAKELLLIEVTETKLFSTFPMEAKMMNKNEKFWRGRKLSIAG